LTDSLRPDMHDNVKSVSIVGAFCTNSSGAV
jgi:hypothetical protein